MRVSPQQFRLYDIILSIQVLTSSFFVVRRSFCLVADNRNILQKQKSNTTLSQVSDAANDVHTKYHYSHCNQLANTDHCSRWNSTTPITYQIEAADVTEQKSNVIFCTAITGAVSIHEASSHRKQSNCLPAQANTDHWWTIGNSATFIRFAKIPSLHLGYRALVVHHIPTLLVVI